MLRIPYSELVAMLNCILIKVGFEREDARLCARLFAETTRDGVYSHGVNRFPRFIEMIKNGRIDVHAKPVVVLRHGAIERWDGRGGPGNLNAYASMERTIQLSREYGIGCVALANTNHWMRGGTYGWQAAEAGMIGICWTNTLANLPPWGATVPALGNNPLVIAAPRPEGHVVLDMAMSQFSYGALASFREKGSLLPVDGGFDIAGHLTRDPAAIELSQRPLPIGYWKGSGLSLMLDIMAATLSGGLSTREIPTDPVRETGLSQVFIALDLQALQPVDSTSQTISEIIRFMLHATESSGTTGRYPGQQVLKTRAEALAQGVPIRKTLWDELSLL
jgi:3-dehydro-L-gulonate 2-dehydrogenase